MKSTHWSVMHTKLAEQYLNTYFRELSINLDDYRADGAFAYNICLADLDISLAFSLSHFSLTGYHRYQFPIYQKDASGVHEVASIEALVTLLCRALAHESTPEAAADLLEQVKNSVQYVTYFCEKKLHAPVTTSIVEDFITAEQGLLLGHPFHVTSKAISGFNEDDLNRYSPELGASFKLHYFAVQPELLKQRVLANFSLPVDPIAKHEACLLLGEKTHKYALLPCHPWQANYLLEQPLVKGYLQSSQLISLGPMGETVWPTSSVRTVWAPQQALFLKLSLDVRITNFIRNNPPSHIERALDASELMVEQGLLEGIPGLTLLPELASQSLQEPSLESSFAILYRQGMQAKQRAHTRILAALVEESPITGQLPLTELIEQAAHSENKTVNSVFVACWWEKYIAVALLPSLQLFAQTGISLEAHLQNSLMTFSDGWPVRLVVRDMEGCSISVKKQPQLPSQSHANYSEEQAWFRFQYYVVVNHIAHVLSAVARNHAISEHALWAVTAQVLHAVEQASESYVYAQRLLESEYFPAKGNLLSTLRQCGENPVWVEITNPLKLNQHVAFCQANEQAEQRVIVQLIEALIYEKVLPVKWCSNHISLQIQLSNTESYHAIAEVTAHFERVRIEPSSLVKYSNGQYRAINLAAIMADLADSGLAEPNAWQAFYDELFHTIQKHAQVLTSPSTQPMRTLDYIALEAKVNNGHLYHPSFKSRLGFTLNDNALYGPELASTFNVKWLAIDKRIANVCLSENLTIEELYNQLFCNQTLVAILNQLRAKQVRLDQVVILPVHPWQWRHIGELYFASRPGVYVLDIAGHEYLPQQSIRTLSDVTCQQGLSLKLAMSITNTSTSRVLAPHTVVNAAMISDWLTQLVTSDDAWQKVKKPILLKEIAGASALAQPNLQAQYGALACIWRESVYSYMTENQQAAPMTALMQVDIDEQPIIAPWIEKHGLENWLSVLIDKVYIPVMHMLWQHGVAMESHAQNMLLIHEQGLPVQVALKDFHDGVRFNPAWLDDPALLPKLTDSPAAHARVNPNSFLQTDDANELRDFTQDALCFVNLAELGWFMQKHFDLKGVRFWQLVRTQIDAYQAQHTHLLARFKLFDFFAPHIDVEQLASRRFLPEQRLRVMPVANPLAKEV